MSPGAAYRVLSGLLLVLIVGCSTPISPYSALDEEENEGDPTPPDAGGPRDAGASDAGRSDAGRGDAGRVDAGPASVDCKLVPGNNFGTLLDDDCATRSPQSCAAPGLSTQQVVNARFAQIANGCGASPKAMLGFFFGPGGCPELFGYNDPSVVGKVSQCIQVGLESLRFSCSLRCGLIGPGAR